MGVRIWQENLIYQENDAILALARFSQEEGQAQVELLFCRCNKAAHEIFLYFFNQSISVSFQGDLPLQHPDLCDFLQIGNTKTTFTCTRIEESKELAEIKKVIDTFNQFQFLRAVEKKSYLNKLVFKQISEEWEQLKEECQVIVAKDLKGRIQAIGACKFSDHLPGLFLEWLATAPWNIETLPDDRKVRGAGTAIIDHCKQIHPHISVQPIAGSIEFYEKCGFRPVSSFVWEFK